MKPRFDLSDHDRHLIHSILHKGYAYQERKETFAIMSLVDFYGLLTKAEVAVIQRWLALDPRVFDYKLPWLGAPEKVDDLVAIRGQMYWFNHERHELPCQYLPARVQTAFEDLNQALQAELGRRLLINYGYRSVARQAFIFFDILARKYNFDVDRTMRRVCLPDYSEHVCPQRQAVDVLTETAVPGEHFDTTAEYHWLQQHAATFGFYESYARDNQLGMMYEPWHWHFETT